MQLVIDVEGHKNIFGISSDFSVSKSVDPAVWHFDVRHVNEMLSIGMSLNVFESRERDLEILGSIVESYNGDLWCAVIILYKTNL